MAVRSVSADSEFVTVKPLFPDSEDSGNTGLEESAGSEFVANAFALTLRMH